MLFAIDQHCQSKGHGALSTNMTEFNELKLSDHSSLLDFINAVRENYSRGIRLESNLPLYWLIVKVLNKLSQEPELNSFITIRNSRFLEMKHHTSVFSTQDLSDELNAIENQIKHLAATPMANAAVKARSRSNLLASSNSSSNALVKPPKKTNTPLSGTNPEAHVKNQRVSKNVDRKCLYCGVLGHVPDIYYYLRPDLRPQEWSLRPNLWCYFKKKPLTSAKPKYCEDKQQQQSGTLTSRTVA